MRWITAAKERLPELAQLVNQRDWTFTRNLIHGPMQEVGREMLYINQRLLPQDRDQANALAADLKEAMADLDEAARLQDGAQLQKAYVAVATGFSNYSKVIPAQALELTASIAIIGAGIVGTATSWHLRRLRICSGSADVCGIAVPQASNQRSLNGKPQRPRRSDELCLSPFQRPGLAASPTEAWRSGLNGSCSLTIRPHRSAFRPLWFSWPTATRTPNACDSSLKPDRTQGCVFLTNKP